MTLQELANKVCGEIPGGWNVIVSMGRDAGSVTLEDPDGESDEYGEYNCDGETIESAILHALEAAVALDPGFCEDEDEE